MQLGDDRDLAVPEAILVHTIKPPDQRNRRVPAAEEGAPAGHLRAAGVLPSVEPSTAKLPLGVRKKQRWSVSPRR